MKLRVIKELRKKNEPLRQDNAPRLPQIRLVGYTERDPEAMNNDRRKRKLAYHYLIKRN